MAIWVVRAGKQGEHEDKFLTDRRIFLTWDALPQDLSGIRDRDSIRMVLRQAYPERPENVLGIWTGEVYAFVNAIEPGDLVVTPRRGKASVSVGVVEGPYQYDVAASQPYWHARAVNWIA